MGLLHSPLSPTDGLVLCLDSANRRSYPGSGNTWFDLSGNDNHGTLINGASYNGLAMNFDGTNDAVSTSCTGVTATNRSAACWFRTNRAYTSGTYGGLIGWGTATTYPADIGKDFIIVIGNDGNLGSSGIGVSQYGDALGFTGFNDGRWHHIYCESRGSLYAVYIDGVFRGSKTMTTNATAGTVKIGNAQNIFYRDLLDDIRIYNRALSPAEIRILFNSKRMRYGL